MMGGVIVIEVQIMPVQGFSRCRKVWSLIFVLDHWQAHFTAELQMAPSRG